MDVPVSRTDIETMMETARRYSIGLQYLFCNGDEYLFCNGDGRRFFFSFTSFLALLK